MLGESFSTHRCPFRGNRWVPWEMTQPPGKPGPSIFLPKHLFFFLESFSPPFVGGVLILGRGVFAGFGPFLGLGSGVGGGGMVATSPCCLAFC